MRARTHVLLGQPLGSAPPHLSVASFTAGCSSFRPYKTQARKSSSLTGESALSVTDGTPRIMICRGVSGRSQKPGDGMDDSERVVTMTRCRPKSETE